MQRRTLRRSSLGGAALFATKPILRRDLALARPVPAPFGHVGGLEPATT